MSEGKASLTPLTFRWDTHQKLLAGGLRRNSLTIA